MNSALQILSRIKTRDFKLDEGVVIQLKSLSLDALEKVQARVKELENDENPKRQFQPILQATVVGLEEVSIEEMGPFLLEDLKRIAEEAMNVGK